jgi:hypothetical protein
MQLIKGKLYATFCPLLDRKGYVRSNGNVCEPDDSQVMLSLAIIETLAVLTQSKESSSIESSMAHWTWKLPRTICI